MRKEKIKPKKCPKCGNLMKPVKDPISHTYTGYLWHCKCMPKDAVLSIG